MTKHYSTSLDEWTQTCILIQEQESPRGPSSQIDAAFKQCFSYSQDICLPHSWTAWRAEAHFAKPCFWAVYLKQVLSLSLYLSLTLSLSLFFTPSFSILLLLPFSPVFVSIMISYSFFFSDSNIHFFLNFLYIPLKPSPSVSLMGIDCISPRNVLEFFMLLRFLEMFDSFKSLKYCILSLFL
jgi:hypothetical protein